MLTNQETFLKLANYKMPYGKYKNRLLIDIPEAYLIWYSQKGFPYGELGDFLKIILEIKVNGLEHLLTPLKKI